MPARNELTIDGVRYSVSGRFLRVACVVDDWYDDVEQPARVVEELKKLGGVDLFTFWQRLPDEKPHYLYPLRWQSISALPVTTYDNWISQQVERTARNKVRKAQKLGVEVRGAQFDDEFVRGMVEIFNETPVRQGRPFVHFGKDFATIKREFARYLFREDLIGAYFESELIGFVMLANAGRYGLLGQFISKFEHRDKATNNLLIAKTVEICAAKSLPYLTYGSWTESSLVDFKRQSGFQEVKLPRYFVPLSRKGELALELGYDQVHDGGWKDLLPAESVARLKQFRARWLSRVQP